jgi:membrane protein DedA with SNARE-associated domain
MERLLDHLLSLDPASVHATLAGILLLCGLGLPIPEDISLISGGYMAHLGVVNVHTVFLVCFAAVLGGDCAAFFLGRYFGRRILGWGPAQRLFSARKQLRVRAYFRKYGSKVIFVGRFLPGLRFSIFFSAGTLHVRPAVFFVYNSLAALLSVPFLVYLAWIFGEHIDRVVHWARRSEYGILIIAILAATFILFKLARYRRQRRRELMNKTAPTPSPAQAQAQAPAPIPPSTLPDLPKADQS